VPPNSELRHEQALYAMRALYLKDDVPWVIGFSGGKDSSAVLQLAYRLLVELPAEKRHKPVHVIASDTLVESPVVEDYLNSVLSALSEGARFDGLPMVVSKVVPQVQETFWVMLLGKGYPSPNRFFRWCTERLKINPTTRYIRTEIDQWGSVVILLGARKSESASRAQVLENRRISGSDLRRHATLPNAYVYAPIADWSAHDVWTYLLIDEAPWGPELKLNSWLRELYRDGAGGECPLVIDKSTPACGQSRFGCWTCTVVDIDNSMEGFLEVGGRYEWMRPLAEFRNKLKAYRDDPSKREKWRRNDPRRPRGWLAETSTEKASLSPLVDENGYELLGPFTLEVRMELLEELLGIQKDVGRALIRDEEIELIRRHWTEDYRVNEEVMLDILERVYGPVSKRREYVRRERRLLEEVCSSHDVDPLVVDRLLDLERGYVTKLKKRNLFRNLDHIIEEWAAVERESECS